VTVEVKVGVKVGATVGATVEATVEATVVLEVVLEVHSLPPPPSPLPHGQSMLFSVRMLLPMLTKL
tara:strand:+ start:140 stop:337 length:198 start_codon:yes stop_codon:yes gene_type:complete